jgi:ribonuclease HI
MDHLDSEYRVIIYTDGACSRNPGPGGWAVLLVKGDTARFLSGFEPYTTNNKMELMAALMALRTLNKSTVADLYTDSRYLRDGINKWIHSWQKKNWLTYNNKPVANQDLWRELLVQNAKHEVHWKWIKAHASSKLNNFVDSLARQAISDRSGVDVRLDLSQLRGMLDGGQISW